MARIDSRIYKSTVERDKAILQTRLAEVAKAEALQQQAANDERRGGVLKKSNRDFISEAELDQFRFVRMTRDAELLVSKTNVDQAKAQLDNSLANLGYTEILAPCDGVVIEKKIDIGQTLAAQFQTPEMFVVAPEMDKRMHIYASVDEADIGMIRKAQNDAQVVRFTVASSKETSSSALRASAAFTSAPKCTLRALPSCSIVWFQAAIGK